MSEKKLPAKRGSLLPSGGKDKTRGLGQPGTIPVPPGWDPAEFQKAVTDHFRRELIEREFTDGDIPKPKPDYSGGVSKATRDRVERNVREILRNSVDSQAAKVLAELGAAAAESMRMDKRWDDHPDMQKMRDRLLELQEERAKNIANGSRRRPMQEASLLGLLNYLTEYVMWQGSLEAFPLALTPDGRIELGAITKGRGKILARIEFVDETIMHVIPYSDAEGRIPGGMRSGAKYVIESLYPKEPPRDEIRVPTDRWSLRGLERYLVQEGNARHLANQERGYILPWKKWNLRDE